MARRYTLDLGEKFDDLLSHLADSQETTKTDAIRRAVAVYAFLVQQAAEGNKLSITDQQGQVLKEVVLL